MNSLRVYHVSISAPSVDVVAEMNEETETALADTTRDIAVRVATFYPVLFAAFGICRRCNFLIINLRRGSLSLLLDVIGRGKEQERTHYSLLTRGNRSVAFTISTSKACASLYCHVVNLFSISRTPLSITPADAAARDGDSYIFLTHSRFVSLSATKYNK